VRQVRAGSNHGCAVTESGETYCWGTDVLGQLGTGGTGSGSASPVRVGGLPAATQVAVGPYHSCALAADGRPWCWGEQRSGQVGIGDSVTTCRGSTEALGCVTVPVAVRGGLRLVALAAGGRSTCGLDAQGAAHCWGGSVFGEHRFPVPVEFAVPRRIASAVPFVALDVAQDGSHACALDAEGGAWCWGPGSGVAAPAGTAVRALPGVAFRSLSLGIGVGCGVGRDGLAYCWGGNNVGQLGIGRFDPAAPAPPVPVPVAGQR
jgi:alpha-tubulin suppressor-like RCC1 family protein